MAEFQSVAPVFAVADIGRTIRWYEQQLGFTGDAFPDHEPYVFAIMYRGVWDAYFRIDGVKDLFESVRTQPGRYEQVKAEQVILCLLFVTMA